MVDSFTDERRKAAREDRITVREELGAIVRAVLLAAVALATGALVGSWVDPPQPAAAETVRAR